MDERGLDRGGGCPTPGGQPTFIQQEGQGLLITAPALQAALEGAEGPLWGAQGEGGPGGSGGRAGSGAHRPEGPQDHPPKLQHAHPASGGQPSHSILVCGGPWAWRGQECRSRPMARVHSSPARHPQLLWATVATRHPCQLEATCEVLTSASKC